MIEFLAAYWLWIAFVIAMVTMHRHGAGCGGHGHGHGHDRHNDQPNHDDRGRNSSTRPAERPEDTRTLP